MQRFVEIDGKRYLWRDILKLRQEQRREERREQLTLFELKIDRADRKKNPARGGA